MPPIESTAPAPPIADPSADLLGQQIDAALAAALEFGPGCPARLAEAMRYAVLGPGKRLRPRMVLMAAQACGLQDLAAAMPAACAVEMVHAYSLSPRRPAGDGRRRSSPRPADLPHRSSTRRRRSSPATHCYTPVVRHARRRRVASGETNFGGPLLWANSTAMRPARPSNWSARPGGRFSGRKNSNKANEIENLDLKRPGVDTPA